MIYNMYVLFIFPFVCICNTSFLILNFRSLTLTDFPVYFSMENLRQEENITMYLKYKNYISNQWKSLKQWRKINSVFWFKCFGGKFIEQNQFRD